RDLLAGTSEDDLRRRDLKPVEVRLLLDPLRPALDPAEDQAVLPAIGLHPLAPLVGHAERRLREDLGGFGVVQGDSFGAILQERLAVGLEVIAEERESQSPLALER